MASIAGSWLHRYCTEHVWCTMVCDQSRKAGTTKNPYVEATTRPLLPRQIAHHGPAKIDKLSDAPWQSLTVDIYTAMPPPLISLTSGQASSGPVVREQRQRPPSRLSSLGSRDVVTNGLSRRPCPPKPPLPKTTSHSTIEEVLPSK